MPKHDAGHSENDLRQGVISHTAEGTIRDRPLEHGPFDEYYLGPEDRKEYGITSEETPYWARDPEHHYWKNEPINRVRQLMGPEHRGGSRARLITNSEGDPIRPGGSTAGDMVLVAIPREVADKQQAEIDQGFMERQGGLRKGENGEWVGRQDITPDDNQEDRIAARDARMRAEHEMNAMSGLIGQGSPTRGMSYTDAVAYMQRSGRAAEVEARQDELRMAGFSGSQPSQQEFAQLMSGRPQRKVQAAMGNSGFGRNPNSAVSQAARARREGR